MTLPLTADFTHVNASYDVFTADQTEINCDFWMTVDMDTITVDSTGYTVDEICGQYPAATTTRRGGRKRRILDHEEDELWLLMLH